MTLSDKIDGYDLITQIVVRGDVKEFIKDLKKEINKNAVGILIDINKDIIDKLAGDKLI